MITFSLFAIPPEVCRLEMLFRCKIAQGIWHRGWAGHLLMSPLWVEPLPPLEPISLPERPIVPHCSVLPCFALFKVSQADWGGGLACYLEMLIAQRTATKAGPKPGAASSCIRAEKLTFYSETPETDEGFPQRYTQDACTLRKPAYSRRLLVTRLDLLTQVTHKNTMLLFLVLSPFFYTQKQTNKQEISV